MSRIETNPRLAWACALETGMRTQACADLEEAGINVQASSKTKGGGSHNDHYWPVYSCIRRMEIDNPALANAGHWLSVNDTEVANRYFDDVCDTVLLRLIMSLPAWNEWRSKRQEKAKALVQARLMMDRMNVDGERKEWSPQDICTYVSEFLGIKMIRNNWYQDGWVAVWQQLGIIIERLEQDAMKPIMEVARKENRKLRDFDKKAA